jgi:hypothetical protein
MTLLTVMEYPYLCHKWHICSTCLNASQSFPHSWLITGFVTRLTRRVSLVEQELITLPEHLSSPPDFSGVRDTRSLVLYHYLYFVDRCLSFCTFSFGHCVVCSYSIYGFRPLVSSNSSCNIMETDSPIILIAFSMIIFNCSLSCGTVTFALYWIDWFIDWLT